MTTTAPQNWRAIWRDSALCDRITELILEYEDAPESEDAGSLRDLIIDQIEDVVQILMESVEEEAFEEAAKVAEAYEPSISAMPPGMKIAAEIRGLNDKG